MELHSENSISLTIFIEFIKHLSIHQTVTPKFRIKISDLSLFFVLSIYHYHRIAQYCKQTLMASNKSDAVNEAFVLNRLETKEEDEINESPINRWKEYPLILATLIYHQWRILSYDVDATITTTIATDNKYDDNDKDNTFLLLYSVCVPFL